MKITCPNCLAAYRIDIPDPDEAGIDVQCGKCLTVFLFSPGDKKPDPAEIKRDTSVKTQDSELPESHPSEPILPPQRDEEQTGSGSKEQAPTSLEEDQGPLETLEQEPLSHDSEPVEIVIEDEPPDDSLEEGSLDDIWNQAMQEGARTKVKPKEKSPVQPSQKPVVESSDEEPVKETPPSLEKKSGPLSSSEDRQQEVDLITEDHQTEQGEPEEPVLVEESPPPLAQKYPQQEKTQEEIDLEEHVTISENEVLPSWEEAFAHRAEVEAGWDKAQKQDRIQEEQQLAEALNEKALPPESTSKETSTIPPQENKRSFDDEVFVEAKGTLSVSKERTEARQPKPEADPIQDEAKSQPENNQDQIDLEEQVAITENEALSSGEDSSAQQTQSEHEDLPTWTDAFSHQSETESTWKEPEQQDDTEEATAISENKEDTPFDPTTAVDDKDLSQDLATMDLKQLVEQAFKEESEQTQEVTAPEEIEAPTLGAVPEEPELTLEVEASLETPAAEQTAPAPHQDEGDIDQTIDSDTSHIDPPSAPEIEPIPELTLESAEEEPAPEPVETIAQEEEPEIELEIEEDEPIWTDDLTYLPDTEGIGEYLEEPEEEPASEPVETVAQEEEPEIQLELEGKEPIWTDAFAYLSDTENTGEYFEEPEEEPASEPVETVAQEEEPEIQLELEEKEPILESAETPAGTETAATDLFEIEPEPELELSLESQDTTAPSEEQPSMSPSLEVEGEELWADLLPEHKEEPLAHKEDPVVFSNEEEGPIGGNDFWDQVLEKDSQESQTADTEAEQSTPVTQSTAEREALTDEELWQQAFPEEEELEPDAPKHFDNEEEHSPSNFPPLVIGADVNLNEEDEPEDSLKYDEAAYAEYDDDDEFEFQRKNRKLGPFTVPHGRRGDWVIGGVMVVFLLIAGSVYFTLQTFAPGELTEIQTAKTEIPEGLSPREIPLDELAGNLTSPKPPEPEKTPPLDTPGDKGEAILSDPVKILEESPEEKGILKDLAESQILKDTGKTQTAKIDESNLQGLTGHSVTMSTIMPVAYNPTDIRVLSFSVEIQLSNAQSAKMVRESMPVYEEIMNQTVEDLLRRKFYNDILYVKEKLQKRLQTAMNKSIKNGHVRTAKFVDFAIQ